MNRVFVTSDTHFFHKNILRFNPETRPWETVEEMNQGLIDNWNQTVDKSDIVYHLGDIAMGSKKNIPDLLAQLNGKTHLILGNHDKMLAGFDQSGIMFIKPLGRQMLDTRQLASIQAYSEISHKGKTVILSHYPMRTWNKSNYGSYMLFGHVHGDMLGEGRSMDVGIDSSDMSSNGRPFLLDDVLAFLENRSSINHH